MPRDPELPFVVSHVTQWQPPRFVGLKDRQRWTHYELQGRVVDRTAWGRPAGERERYRIALRRIETTVSGLTP